MALTLQQASQQLNQLVNFATQQVSQEDASDSLSGISLGQLKSMLAGVAQTAKELEKESAVFSEGADLSSRTDDKLGDLISDIREASRKLAIVLAAGSNQFRNQDLPVMNTLNSLSTYVAPEIADHLNVAELSKILQIGASCAHSYAAVSRSNGCFDVDQDFDEEEYGDQRLCGHGQYTHQCQHCREESTFSFSGDLANGSTAADTISKLSLRLSELAKECEKRAVARRVAVQEKGEKETMVKKIIANVEDLMPMLKSHVLRVGIGKGQHLNISQGCGNVSTIQSLFSYACVEGAHRQLEDVRDRILQELAMRKLEKRMKRGSPRTV